MTRDELIATIDSYVAEQVTLQTAADQQAVDSMTTQVNELEADIAVLNEEIAALQEELSQYESNPPEDDPVFSENFADLSHFGVYNGAGSYSQQGVRLKSNFTVSNNVLTVWVRPVTTTTTIDGKTLKVGDYAAGGGMWDTVLSPGSRIELDLQMNACKGSRAVALLWPYQVGWPEGGELDFVENGADIPDRQSTAITNHWANSTGGNAQKVIKFGPHDFTLWSHVTVLWQTGLFVVTVDGQEAARYTEHVPTNKMKLAFQTAVAGGGQSPNWNGAPRTAGFLKIKNLNVYSA